MSDGRPPGLDVIQNDVSQISSSRPRRWEQLPEPEASKFVEERSSQPHNPALHSTNDEIGNYEDAEEEKIGMFSSLWGKLGCSSKVLAQ
jgi:hypothetical protein